MEKKRARSEKYYGVRFKLLLSVLAIILVLIVTQTAMTLRTTRLHSESLERQNLLRLYDDYQSNVNSRKEMALALAMSFADRPDVAQALRNQDRQALTATLLPVFQTLQSRYADVYLYVYQPDGTTFVRIHDLETYGDTVTSFRPDVVAALETQRPLANVSLGPYRFGVRGITPIFDQGGFVGLVEISMDYAEIFLERSNEIQNADYMLWVSSEAATHTGLKPPPGALTAPSSQLFFYAGTYPSSLPIPEPVYLNALQHDQPAVRFVAQDGQSLAIMVAPVTGFDGQVIGILEILVSRDPTLQALRRNQIVAFLVATGLTVLALALTWGMAELVVLRALRHLNAIAQRQLEGDLAARVEFFPRDEFGRMGQTFNRLTEQVVSSISKLELQVELLHRAERALAYEQYLTRALLNTVPDHIYFKDLQSRFIRISKSQAVRFGLSDPEEALGKSDFDFFSEEHANQAYQDEQRIIQTGEPIVGYEEKETWSDGSVTWVSTTKMPLLDENGKIMGIVGISREITDRKNSEAEILRLQQLLQNVSDSMPSALIALDATGQVLLWNPAAQALTGCTLQQIAGQSVWQICPMLTRYQSLFEEVLRTQRVQHRHQDTLAMTDATLVHHNVDIFPLMSGAVSGAVMRIDDVTERVQLEEMMLQSAKMASVGGLAAGVAHELNNPLGAMVQSAQVLEMALDTQRARTQERMSACGVDVARLEQYLQDRGIREYLAGIRQTGERAAKIVSDLLNFSRKSTAEFTSQNLNELVEQTLELAATDYDLGRKYDFKDIEIVREITTEMPNITCDKQQIQQVILNLVRNAAYAMSEKKVTATDGDYRPRMIIRTRLTPACEQNTEMHARLEVEDNGPGFSTATQSHLFEPFFTTKDVGEGTGLGLWLCWSIVVERHGGRIWDESPPEGGARLIVELPTVQQ